MGALLTAGARRFPPFEGTSTGIATPSAPRGSPGVKLPSWWAAQRFVSGAMHRDGMKRTGLAHLDGQERMAGVVFAATATPGSSAVATFLLTTAAARA